MQASLSLPGRVTAGRALGCELQLRNVGQAAVALPPADAAPEAEAFAWVLFVQRTDEGRKSFYTARIPLLRGAKSWPAALAAGKVAAPPPAELSALAAHPYDARRRIVRGYPAAGGGAKPAPRTVASVLAPGKALAKAMVYLPRRGDRPLLLQSNVVVFAVERSAFERLAPDERRKRIAEILARFDRDAWAAKKAHDEAVAIGRPILPDLIAAAKERNRPSHSRLWLATAVADIPDARAAAALIELLGDPSGGVRHVAAYYGPKQRSAKLDAALVEKFAGGKDTRGTALAVLGYLCFRGQVPGKLLAASFESPDPRVRSLFASALKNHASDFNVSRLVSLLRDKEPRVRSAAAKALGAFGTAARSAAAVGALVSALDLPGEAARASIADALGKLTGHRMPYDPKADEAARKKALQAWKDWWAGKTKSDRRRN